MSQNTAIQRMKTSDMSREDFTELFVDVLKLCRPKHPYHDDQVYDEVTTEDIIQGYCRSDSNYCARCGPRRSPHVASYSIDHTYFQKHSIEHDLAVTVHEVTHITVGRHSRSGKSPVHPPEFWNTMAFHTQRVLDEMDQIEQKWGKIDVDKFRRKVIEDPNSSMVDRRTESVSDVRNRLTSWIANYPTNTP